MGRGGQDLAWALASYESDMREELGLRRGQ